MKFSIVTPSFRNSRWLKLCIASVADQQGVELEHIVQDSCSDDGTQDWLPHDRRVRAFIEKDGGMYDVSTAVTAALRATFSRISTATNNICPARSKPSTIFLRRTRKPRSRLPVLLLPTAKGNIFVTGT